MDIGQGQHFKADLYNAYGTDDRAMRDALMSKPIDFWMKFASGDRAQMTEAASPMLTAIAEQTRSAKERLYDDPRMPASMRQFGLMSLGRQGADTAARAMYQPWMSSFDKLGEIGAGYGGSALQYAGAGLRAGEGAAQSYGQRAEIDAKRNKAKWDFFGNLAGLAGSIATGGLLGGGGGKGTGDVVT